MLITSFVIMLGVITGTMYISGTGSHKENNSLLGEITVYTTLPTENVSYLAEAYEKNYHVKVNFMPMSEDDIVKQMQKPGRGDMVLTDSRILRRSAGAGWLVPYGSLHGDSVSNKLKDPNDYWTGTWYDPVVFCINKDYMQRTANFPLGWQDLAEQSDIRIGITDFLAAESAANL